MTKPKFTMNAFVLVVTIFSAIILFITVKLSGIAGSRAINDYYQIEGTPYGIRYSSALPNGIYNGQDKNSTLLLEGTFGYDWGAVVSGNDLYINEYSSSDFGNMYSRVVRVDLTTFEKQTIYNDAVLRGKCASGEIVCERGVILPVNCPDTNRMTKLYSLTGNKEVSVVFIDPVSGEAVYQRSISEQEEKKFESLFLEQTLQGVMG